MHSVFTDLRKQGFSLNCETIFIFIKASGVFFSVYFEKMPTRITALLSAVITSNSVSCEHYFNAETVHICQLSRLRVIVGGAHFKSP